MAAPGPEWMLWAKRLRDEHAHLVQSVETLSSTVAKAPSPAQINNLEASQLALQQEVKSLHDTLAIAEQQREQHTRIADERDAALEEHAKAEAQLRDRRDKVTNEQIRKLEKEVAALSRRAPSASKLREKSAETIGTSPLSSENLANVSEGSSQRSSMQIYLEESAQRKRNWSGQAQRWPSSIQNLDSDETGDHSNASSKGPPTQIHLETSAQRKRNWNGQAEQILSCVQDLDSDETRDHSKEPEAFQSTSPSETHETPKSAKPKGQEALQSATFSDTSSLVSIMSFPHAPTHAPTYAPEASAQALSPPAVALEPQGGLDLFEYLIQCEDEITSRLLMYEKQLVEAFVAGLSDKMHKSTLRERLDQQAWNWKIAFEGANEIAEDALASRRPGKSKPSPSRNPNGRFKKKPRR